MQIIALIVAVYNLYRITNSLRPGDAPRKAWARIGIGMGIWLIGQLLESYCDLVLKQISYGTVADAFWMIGYFPLISGVYLFFENYKSTGLPLGNTRTYVVIGTLLTLIYGVILYLVIWPNLSDVTRGLIIRILDFSYPTFDFIIIAVCSILIRISWDMRGGSIAKSWIMLGMGFVMTAVADLLLQVSEDTSSIPYRAADIVYFAGYFLVALSAQKVTAETQIARQ
jgi:hypothetical protein